jgi:hypothetical protein
MSKCDICGKKEYPLYSLLSIYSTKDINEVCSECGDDINNVLDKFRKITRKAEQKHLKRYIKIKKKGAIECLN